MIRESSNHARKCPLCRVVLPHAAEVPYEVPYGLYESRSAAPEVPYGVY